MASDRDNEQDQMIRENAVRISRNEESIKRQTEALEKIRDHFYPPPAGWWKKSSTFIAKVVCVIVAYLGIAETVDWLWKSREANALAEGYAEVAQRLYSEEGDLVGSILCLEKAVKIDPKESEYVMSLSFLKGIALAAEFMDNERSPTDAEQAKMDAALAEALVQRELQPENPLPYILVAQAFLLKGETEEAVAAVEEAVARKPMLAPVRVSACAINFAAGRLAQARAHLAEAERLKPELPLVSVWKGTFALQVDHDPAAARSLAEALVRRMPRLVLAHILLGRAMLAEKNPDLKLVRRAFNRALVLNAKLPGTMMGIAETYEREGRTVLARLWLNRAIGVNASYLPALLARARVCGRLGEWRSAEADLTTAIELDPFRADLYLLRAEACEKAGDAAQANSDRATAAALASERTPTAN